MLSRKPNLVEAVVRELAVVMVEDAEVAEEATIQDHKVAIATNQLVKGASAITVAHHICQGSVLPMGRIASTVAKVAIT